MKNEIYTVDYCPYCKKALAFLKEHNVDFLQHRIDDDEHQGRMMLAKKFNIKTEVTVPQIVINGEHIGGYTDMIEKFNKGELKF